MPRNDPRGEKVRFHVWLYEQDIAKLRERFGKSASVNSIVRRLVSKTVDNIEARVQSEVYDRETPVEIDL